MVVVPVTAHTDGYYQFGEGLVKTIEGLAHDSRFDSRFENSEKKQHIVHVYGPLEEGADVYVGGVGMFDGDYLAEGATATTRTKPADNYAYYKDGVLTLHNYDYEGAGYYGAIFTFDELTIVLEGKNTLNYNSTEDGACVLVDNNLTIKGNGSLENIVSDNGFAMLIIYTLTVADATVTADSGVWADNIVINSGKVSVPQLYAFEDITVNGGTVVLHNDHGDSLNADNLTVNGGSINSVSSQYPLRISNDFTLTGGYVCAKSTAGNGSFWAFNVYGNISIAEGYTIKAALDQNGNLGEYDPSYRTQYDLIEIKSDAPQTFTVTFIGKNGDVLKSETVEFGSSATAPEAPAVAGYTFTGWDKSFDNVTGDLSVNAVYEKVVLLGDVNGDGYVDNLDAAMILKYDAGILDSINEATADVNGDGYTDNLDAAKILKYDAGIIDSL